MMQPKSPAASSEFSQLSFNLGQYKTGDWYVFVGNQSDQPLTQVQAVCRSSVCYDVPLTTVDMPAIAAGSNHTQSFPRGKVRTAPAYAGGRSIVAVELNFMLDDKAGRVYVTRPDSGPQTDVMAVRDVARVVGPIAAEGFDFTPFVSFSQPDATMKPISDSPLGHWQQANDNTADMFAYDRVYPFGKDKTWWDAARPFDRKDNVIVTAVDIVMPKAGALKVASDLKVLNLAVDGKVMSMTRGQTDSTLSEGVHRVVLAMGTNRRVSFRKAKPALLWLSVDDQPVTYKPMSQ